MLSGSPSIRSIEPVQVRELTGVGIFGPLARVFFIAVILGGSWLTWRQPAAGLGLAYGPVLAGYVMAGMASIYYFLCFAVRTFRKATLSPRVDNWLEYVQAAIDSVLVLATVYISGSQTTSWVVLILVLAVYYMTTAGPRFGTGLSVFLGFAYAVIVFLESRHLIPYAPIHSQPVFHEYVSLAVVNFGAVGSVAGALIIGNFVGWVTFRALQRTLETEVQVSRKYDELIHGISDIIWECGRDQNYTFVSESARALLGYGPDELTGRNFRSICSADDLTRVDAWLNGGNPEKGGVLDYSVVARDLTLHWISTTVTPIFDSDGRFVGFRGTARDVTNARIAEERLSRAQRYEAVAALASGIAHDFNNLFNAINGFAQLERLNAADGTEPAENLDAIIKAARRGTALTSNLLNLSRPQLFQKGMVNPAELLEHTRQIARASMGGRILIDIDIRTRRQILGDENLLSTVILNLCLNARDAIGSRDGRILMSVDESGDGRQVIIAVEDNGTGIPPELHEKIFLPFYTTKPRGSGTGLGLAMARKIVTEHGGTLEPGSSTLGGAAFVLTLPAADGMPHPGQTPRAASTSAGPVRRLRVMVVDDEESNLVLVAKLLERRGHTVMPFSSGVDALRWMERLDKPVDVAVLDMVMPEKSGIETFHELRAMQPGLPVLFISGYAEAEHLRSVLAASKTWFLPKPLDLDRFADTLEKSVHIPVALSASTG